MHPFSATWHRVLIGLLFVISLVSCGDSSSQIPPETEPVSEEIGTSPLSPPAMPENAESSDTDEETLQPKVLAARFHGDWAPGYPYPVFFYDVPYGKTTVVLDTVQYSENGELVNEAHPRLEKVELSILWPDGSESVLQADSFVYDETQGVLMTYDAYENSQSLETYAVDVRAASGVGLAFLGDTSGINVFHNCTDSTVISREQLATDESGNPTESIFRWECQGDSYETKVEMSWGVVNVEQNVDVITELLMTISREK